MSPSEEKKRKSRPPSSPVKPKPWKKKKRGKKKDASFWEKVQTIGVNQKKGDHFGSGTRKNEDQEGRYSLV